MTYLDPKIWEAIRHLMEVLLERPISTTEDIADSIDELTEKLKAEKGG